jgi:hypothetical protein
MKGKREILKKMSAGIPRYAAQMKCSRLIITEGKTNVKQVGAMISEAQRPDRHFQTLKKNIFRKLSDFEPKVAPIRRKKIPNHDLNRFKMQIQSIRTSSLTLVAVRKVDVSVLQWRIDFRQFLQTTNYGI